MISIISNKEVKLNAYVYPDWAHAIGWVIVAIILAPIPIYFVLTIRRNVKKYGRFDSEVILKILEPHETWKPAISKEEQEKFINNRHRSSVIELYVLPENETQEARLKAKSQQKDRLEGTDNLAYDVTKF